MESAKRSASGRVILALQKKSQMYTTELSYETRISLRHLSTNALPRLVAEGIVKTRKIKNRIYYELTDVGKILATALSNPEHLTPSLLQPRKRIKPNDLPPSINIDLLKKKLNVTGISFDGAQVELRGTLSKDLLLKIKKEKVNER